MNLTKKNGTKLKKNRKGINFKKTYPKSILSITSKKGVNLTHLNKISYKDPITSKIITEEMSSIISHPIPKYSSKKLLMKKVIIKTNTGKSVKIQNIDRLSLFVYGTLL